MDNRTAELLTAGSGGATLGVAGGLKLFALQLSPMTFPAEVALKMLATIFLAALGGVFGMLARDVYTYWIRPKIKMFNPKKDTDVG